MTAHEMRLENLRYLFHSIVNHEFSLKLIDAWLTCLRKTGSGGVVDILRIAGAKTVSRTLDRGDARKGYSVADEFSNAGSIPASPTAACLREESKLGEVPDFHDRGFDADIEVDRRANR